MAFYLVSAVPKQGLMEELSERLGRDAFAVAQGCTPQA
jgi:hypothetical protein